MQRGQLVWFQSQVLFNSAMTWILLVWAGRELAQFRTNRNHAKEKNKKTKKRHEKEKILTRKEPELNGSAGH